MPSLLANIPQLYQYTSSLLYSVSLTCVSRTVDSPRQYSFLHNYLGSRVSWYVSSRPWTYVESYACVFTRVNARHCEPIKQLQHIRSRALGTRAHYPPRCIVASAGIPGGIARAVIPSVSRLLCIRSIYAPAGLIAKTGEYRSEGESACCGLHVAISSCTSWRARWQQSAASQ